MERRIVLLGKTGSGKSAAGNTILKGTYFEVKPSAESVTKRCDVKEVCGIKVIDTPGMFDTRVSPDDLKREISRCMSMSVPGPHVFLLVIKLGIFTEEEKKAVKNIQKIFGEDASLYTIVLFTHTDQLGEQTLEEFLSGSAELKNILKSYGNHYHAFNNNDPSPSQVDKLMEKIDHVVKMNRGTFYTNHMYEKAQRSRDEGILETALAGAAVVVGVAAAVGMVAFALTKK